MDRETIVGQVVRSACFTSESAWLARGGFNVISSPRLFKFLESEKVRVVFPTNVHLVEEGAAVGLVCLFDQSSETTVYAHAVFAGPSVNSSLHALFVPPTQVKPQPGLEGYKAIQQFESWKQAAWVKFRNDELELGTSRASATWIANFWKALDRMYGGGNLLDVPVR